MSVQGASLKILLDIVKGEANRVFIVFLITGQ